MEEKVDMEEKPTTRITWKVMKNVVVLALAYTFHFTGYNGTVNIQSSINAEAGLGAASLAAVYAGLIFSNIFLPVAVIKWLGTKWTICFSCLTYIPYILGQWYPTFYTLIPAGFFVGLGAGPLWCAQGTYLAMAADANESATADASGKKLLVRFLGLFYMIFQTNQIWGNLISSLVLSSGNNTAATTNINETMIPLVCGANFLPTADDLGALVQQPPEKIQMISGIYLACLVGAILLVAVFLDPLKRKEVDGKPGGVQSGFALLIVTLKHCAQPTQLLLITLNVFIGMHQAFFGADFTASFISCAVGTSFIGFVMMMYGVSNATGCLVTGYLVKVYGRLPLMICALIVHVSLCVTILVWHPRAGDAYVMFIIAGLWGVCDSVWTVQMSAYYGILFAGNEEAAFSSYRLWESLGFIIAFSISPYVMTRYKIILLMSLMIIGSFGYYIVEYQQYKLRENKKEIQEKKEEVPMMKTEQ